MLTQEENVSGVDKSDLPVCEEYVETTLELVRRLETEAEVSNGLLHRFRTKLRVASKWLNAISIEIRLVSEDRGEEAISALAQKTASLWSSLLSEELPFVSRVQEVSFRISLFVLPSLLDELCV